MHRFPIVSKTSLPLGREHLTLFWSRMGLLALGFWWMIGARGFAVDFEHDIEPILQTQCLDCHGPDEQSSHFRVDRLAPMLQGGDSGEPALVPGDPSASHLMKLIRREEPGFEMPPDEPLSQEQVGLIERWIAEGADTPPSYGPGHELPELTHWSFQPVVRTHYADSIDRFIAMKREANGLTSSPQANRRVLIRRLYLVMLGIPPSPEKVEAFANDDRSDAWQRLVEQVLASPQYGERLGSMWLDLVRFGETHGFEMNRERPTAWPYRDWVIRAFNNDKPYDQFVRAQIAGDAIGDPVGTGFLVAGPMDQVKGQDAKLQQTQRMNELDDMINTCGTTFLGLTTGCARCHNHKFDPITQKDYYAMQAVFAGVQHGDGKLALTEKQQNELLAIDTKIAELESSLAKFLRTDDRQIATTTHDAVPAMRPPVSAAHNVDRFAERDARFIRFTIEATNGGEPCIDELQIFAGNENVALATVGAKTSSSGDFQHPKHKLEHINDGLFGNSHSWISAQPSGGWVQIDLAVERRIDRIEWARDRNGKYTDRLATDYRIECAVEPDVWELVASSADRVPFDPSGAERADYDFASLPSSEAEQGRNWLKQLKAFQSKRTQLEANRMAWIGNFSQPGATFRLYRGEPDAPRERVGPDAITAFRSLQLSIDTPEQQRRVALANWVSSHDNPLTARVMVNRLWQFHFGVGIVDTPSDFGKNGVPPSHPELLDWLAAELVDSGWSLKHIHRLILNSNTWRQDSHPNSDAFKIDAGNRLLWRFAPRRLEAEAIRDSILAVTGVLDLESAGGPGFSAFEVQMENVRHYHAKENYGPADWRRMIYMTKVRQEKDQVFGAFDCPDASMVVPKRSRSTTPLQALNLLNSRFVNQQAEILAARLEQECSGDLDRIRRAWELCVQRDPTGVELVDSSQFIQQQGLVQFARAMLNTNEFVFIP